MHRLLRILACCALAVQVVACGARHAAQPPVVAGLTPLPASLPTLPASLPALPPDLPLNPQRATAGVQAQQAGADFITKSANANSTGAGLELASGPNAAAWGLYLFGGAPGETISELSYSLTGLDPGETVYCGIGNYTTGQWQFLPVAAQATATFTLPSSPNQLQSPLGNTWIVLATFGGDAVTVADLSLNYPDRHSVTGQVVDQHDVGLAGVTVRSVFAGLKATTAADGTYTLAGLPDGVWPVLCTLDGYAFYSQPTNVTLAGADVTAPEIIGDPHGSRFDNFDLLPNNNQLGSPSFDLEHNVLSESLSADDDPLDYYNFTVTATGNYLLRLTNPGRDLRGPQLALTDAQDNTLAVSASVLDGDVCVGFAVASAPQTFNVRVSCLGQGGKYALQLTNDAYATLRCQLTDGVSTIGGGGISVLNTASGGITDYLIATLFNPLGGVVLYDQFYPVGNAKLTPHLPGYVAAPTSKDVAVQAGMFNSAVFTVTPPAAADSFEPNNSTGTAFPLPFPYNSATAPDPLQLTINGDTIDYYKCTPPAGTALSVLLTDPGIHRGGLERYAVRVLDSALKQISIASVQEGTIVTLPSALCDGNPVYVQVAPSDYSEHILSYGLRVLAIPAPVELQFAARVGGTDLLADAQFDVYDSQFDYVTGLVAGPTGLTKPLYITAGTQLRVDCYRYATAHDHQTQQYTVPASDSILYFESADLGPDALEPNDSAAVLSASHDLPLAVDATISSLSDPYDMYRLKAGDGLPFRIELTQAAGQSFDLNLLDENDNIVQTRLDWNGVAIYLPNDGMDGQVVSLHPHTFTETSYHLSVSTGPAYQLFGVVQDNLAVGLPCVVQLQETGRLSQLGGSYNFGLLPPGDYHVSAFCPNYNPSYSVQTVTITNADVAADFTGLVAEDHDALEPNDSFATAVPVTLGQDYAASSSAADNDNFKLSLAAGDVVRIALTPSTPGQAPLLYTYDNDQQSYHAWAPLADGSYNLSFVAPSAAVYYFVVAGQSEYALRIDAAS